MPAATAAVARAVPVTALPVPTVREQKRMGDAYGKRKQSADAEFRRCVKETLNYRLKWDTKFTDDQKRQRASDGCSRFHPGAHFPQWKYGVEVDPYKDGLVLQNPEAFAPRARPT
eukprot:11661287-Heterocapsa_arctica.AAC.1